jgi:hypothetical protein
MTIVNELIVWNPNNEIPQKLLGLENMSGMKMGSALL